MSVGTLDSLMDNTHLSHNDTSVCLSFIYACLRIPVWVNLSSAPCRDDCTGNEIVPCEGRLNHDASTFITFIRLSWLYQFRNW
jgi:hypothetical protein